MKTQCHVRLPGRVLERPLPSINAALAHKPVASTISLALLSANQRRSAVTSSLARPTPARVSFPLFRKVATRAGVAGACICKRFGHLSPSSFFSKFPGGFHCGFPCSRESNRIRIDAEKRDLLLVRERNIEGAEGNSARRRREGEVPRWCGVPARARLLRCWCLARCTPSPPLPPQPTPTPAPSPGATGLALPHTPRPQFWPVSRALPSPSARRGASTPSSGVTFV